MKEYTLRNSKHVLRYHDLPGKEQTILFIHGLGCAGSFDYPEVASQPLLAEHRCLLVDLIGAGFSDKPLDFDYSITAHANYLMAFIEDLALENIILFGHSLGGAIALALAAKCPEKIARIILSEANLDAGGGFASKAIAAFPLKAFVDFGFEGVIQENKAAGNQMWAASLAMWLPQAVHEASCSLIAGQKPSWREILYKASCPKTYIFGEQSLPDPDQEVLTANHVHIEIVANAGHSMAWENPEGLAQAIKNSIDF